MNNKKEEYKKIHHRFKLVKYKILAEKIILATFEPDSSIDFLAGQFFSFKVEEKVNRPYSVASAPLAGTIDFLVDLSPMGPGSKFFQTLVIEEIVEVMGPFGFFTAENFNLTNSAETIVFACTGTGVAPFRSMIFDLLENQSIKNDIYLFFGIRHNNQSYFFDEFESLAKKHSNFKFIPVISQPDKRWKGEVGHCQDAIERLKIPKDSNVLICGATKNVVSINDDLLKIGFDSSKIFFEKYG